MAHRVDVDEECFVEVFGQDRDYRNPLGEVAYLDAATGAIECVYPDSEQSELAGVPGPDNVSRAKAIDASPDRYLRIPRMSHGEHHEILQEFLASEWCQDPKRREAAKLAYPLSIGGWLRAVRDNDATRAYMDFRDQAVRRRAREWLTNNGIDPGWPTLGPGGAAD